MSSDPRGHPDVEGSLRLPWSGTDEVFDMDFLLHEQFDAQPPKRKPEPNLLRGE